MSIKCFARNYAEEYTTTVTNALAASPATRLYDRIRGLQCIATGTGQWDIKVDLTASPPAVTGFALLNHNLGVAGITLASSPDDVTYTTRDTFTGVSGTDVFREIATQTVRYWRLRVPVFASAPAIGEFLLGIPLTLTDPANDPGAIDRVHGNVERDETPGGWVWKIRRGSSRVGYGWTWKVEPNADWNTLKQIFSEAHESAKNVLVVDQDGVLRWVEIVDAHLEAQRVVSDGAGGYIRTVGLKVLEAF